MKHLETIIEERKERFVRNSLMSDEFLDFINKNKKPIDKLMSYYQCAIMEVETKFKVLNEQYSLEYDRNPIEDIKSRVKSMDSLIKKIRRKDIPITIPSIEENIHDIAGVRIICSFPDDIYMRTIAMDFWASLEHKLRYKKNIPADKAKYLEDEMLACAKISADLDMRMQHVRNVIAENATKKHCEIW